MTGHGHTLTSPRAGANFKAANSPRPSRETVKEHLEGRRTSRNGNRRHVTWLLAPGLCYPETAGKVASGPGASPSLVGGTWRAPGMGDRPWPPFPHAPHAAGQAERPPCRAHTQPCQPPHPLRGDGDRLRSMFSSTNAQFLYLSCGVTTAPS